MSWARPKSIFILLRMDIEDGFESVRDVFGSTDLLVHILQFLDEPVDKDAACRVNKSWLHAFQSVPQRLAFRYVCQDHSRQC